MDSSQVRFLQFTLSLLNCNYPVVIYLSSRWAECCPCVPHNLSDLLHERLKPHLAPGPHTNRANNVKWRSSFFGDFWSNFNDGENLRNSFVLLRSSFLVLRNSFLLNQITLKSQDLISGPYTKKELRDFETQMNYKKKLCMEIKL